MSEINVTKIAHFTGHTGAVYSLCTVNGGAGCYSGAADGYVVLWNTQSGGDGQLLVKVNRPVYSMFNDEKQGRLFCGTASGNLHVIDLETKAEVRNIEAHQMGVFDIAAYGERLITAGGDGSLKVWDMNSLQLLLEINQSQKSARCMAINEAGNTLAVGYSDHHIRTFSLDSFTLQHVIAAHQNSVFSIAFTQDGSELLSGGRDALLKTWLVSNQYAPDLALPAHTLHINHIAFNPSGTLFATVSMDKTIKLWQTERMQLLKVIDKGRLDGHLSSVNRCVWISDTRLITASDDRTVMIWEIETK